MKFQCKEAFCLMQYQDEEDSDAPIEWLWNSRDGVTPFIIQSEDGQKSLKHISWRDDILTLQYVPNIGQRVFIDLTEARALELLRKRVENQWSADTHELHPRSRWDSKGDMIYALTPTALKEVERRGPDIVVCTLELQRKFVADRECRRLEFAGSRRRFA